MSDTDNNLPSEAQRDFAMKIAERLEIEIDENILINKDDLSEWIKEHNNLPSPKQIDLAEQIAEKIGEDLSEELLEDSEKLSTFIDENIHLISSNKPSTKQISFAKNIAKKLKIDLPNELLEDKKLLNRNLKKELSKKRQALKRQEASNINEDNSNSKSILDNVIDKLSNVEVGPKFNKAINSLKSKLNLPSSSNIPKFVKNLAIAQELIKNRLFSEQVELDVNKPNNLKETDEILNEEVQEINKEVNEVEKTTDENKSKEKHIPENQSLFEKKIPKSATVGNNVAPILEAIEEVLEQSPTEKSSSIIVNSSNNYSQDKSEFIVFKTTEGLNVENNNIFTEESIKNNFKGFIDFRATSEFQQAANQSKQFLINKRNHF